MTIDEFARIYNIKPKTVMKRLNDIPGWVNGENGIEFPSGSRYPIEKKYSTTEETDRIYAVLKSISRNRYIDHIYLGIEQCIFEQMLTRLSETGLIYDNGTDNPYGANKYNITIEGSSLIEKRKLYAYRQIASILGEFVGGFFSGMNS